MIIRQFKVTDIPLTNGLNTIRRETNESEVLAGLPYMARVKTIPKEGDPQGYQTLVVHTPDGDLELHPNDWLLWDETSGKTKVVGGARVSKLLDFNTLYIERCFNCNEPMDGGEASHITINNTAGPWHCDHCGHGNCFRRTSTNSVVELNNPYRQRKIPVWVLLRFNGVTKYNELFHIVVPSAIFLNTEVDDLDRFIRLSDSSFYYNEHTCPWNYLQLPSLVGRDDSDAHGIFRFVQTVPVPADYDKNSYASINEYLDVNGWDNVFNKLTETPQD